MEIRSISNAELPAAMDLVWKVFLEFEAPDFPQEGVNTFKAHIDGQAANLTIQTYGAYEMDELLGVIATRNEGSHISLFFVRKENHGQGVGKKLFEHIIPLCNNDVMTVNSSPYAVEIYRKLGFHDTDVEQLADGIRYVPMCYDKKAI